MRKSQFSVAMHKFQVLNSCMMLAASVLDSTVYRPFLLSQKVITESVVLGK